MSQFNPKNLNLASQPFRRERAEMASFLFVCALLTCSLLLLIGLILNSRAGAADLRLKIAADNAQLESLQREQGKFSSVLARPENVDIFTTSAFLNQLIARRGVSWTRVFKDLATVMPENIRLLSIRLPQVGQEDQDGVNRVELDMIVGTKQPEAFIVFLKRLAASSYFGATALANQTPPAQNDPDPLYKYRLTVAYAQKL